MSYGIQRMKTTHKYLEAFLAMVLHTKHINTCYSKSLWLATLLYSLCSKAEPMIKSIMVIGEIFVVNIFSDRPNHPKYIYLK